MARIAGVSAQDAGTEVQTILESTRQYFGWLTGRDPERAIEPLELYAHTAGLLQVIGSPGHRQGSTASTGASRRWPS